MSHSAGGDRRADQLDRALSDLLASTSEIEAAAVVSFDGLAMASALPDGMDEDRVAAMSAALLSLGERATQGLGRGELSQVFIEGEQGTVFLVACEDEAVLVAVAAKGAKTGLMLYEIRRVAAQIAKVFKDEGLDLPTPPSAAPVEAAPPAATREGTADAVPVLPPPTGAEPSRVPTYDYAVTVDPGSAGTSASWS